MPQIGHRRWRCSHLRPFPHSCNSYVVEWWFELRLVGGCSPFVQPRCFPLKWLLLGIQLCGFGISRIGSHLHHPLSSCRYTPQNEGTFLLGWYRKIEPLQKMILSVHCAQDVTGLNRKKLTTQYLSIYFDLWQALITQK